MTQIKKTSLISFLIISIFLLSIFFTSTKASSITNLNTEERIERAQKQIKNIDSDPEKITVALISFNELKPKEFSKEIAEQYNLKVSQIYAAHASNEKIFRQGYFVSEDGIIRDDDLRKFEEQIKNSSQLNIDRYKQMAEEARKDIESFKQKELKLPDGSILVTGSDEENEKALEASTNALKNEEEFLEFLKKNGLEVYGLWVEAKNSDLTKLRKNPSIELLELINEKIDQRAMPLLPGK